MQALLALVERRPFAFALGFAAVPYAALRGYIILGSDPDKGEFFRADRQAAWNEIDDVFFETRGTAWALIQFLRAVEVDFADVGSVNRVVSTSFQLVFDEGLKPIPNRRSLR